MASKKTGSSRKKTAAKKKTSHYPVVRGAQLEISTGLPGTLSQKVVYVDRELSKMNRRLYRHARNYQVKVDLHPDATGKYQVFALRDDWAVSKGLQMAYQMYLETTSEERAVTNSARWEDFRTELGISADQFVATFHDGISTQPLITGEFELSRVQDDAGVDRTFTWDDTPTATQFGILTEYDKAGNAERTPTNATGDVPYRVLNDELRQQTAADLQNKGNSPPYDTFGVNAGGPFVNVGNLGAFAGSQRLSTGFFNAPCGFVLIVAPAASDQGTSVMFEVKAGDYKGVHAPSMLE